MRKAAESEIEEIKKRAFEEADSISESARGDVVGACGASTMTSIHEAQTNSTVVGRNDADEASSILRFAQAFATEVRDEATRVLANARAEAKQLLSNARANGAAVPSSGSATIADREKMRREREASRKRRKYWETRSWPDDSTEVQESAVVQRDKGDRHIRRIVSELVNLFNKSTRSISRNPTLLKVREMCCFCPSCIDEDWDNCSNFEYTGPWTLHNVHPRKPADVVDYVDAIGHGQGIGDQWVEGTIADVVEVGDFFAVEAEWPNDYSAEFWILQCTKPLHVLADTITDPYGETHEEGSSVLEGIWYQQFGKSPTCFVRYDSSPLSVVAARRVIHVRFALLATGVSRNSIIQVAQ
ncbi:hypothetical protein R1sor_004059 [Riccia sorocarpa]|uniref:Uncharacterized protein n=1 Tax=Riccia sorocarpa TaxID=122646 RepID=A0ABD3H683_9MARC